MALSQYETSADRGVPVELFLFVYSDDGSLYHAYTSADDFVTFDGITYTPLPVKRDGFKARGRNGSDGQELTVEVPLNSEISDLFRIYPPSRVVTLTIRQGHLANPDDPLSYDQGNRFEVIWVGRILESRRNGNRTALSGESAAAGMKRVGLRRHYQWPCPLVLYGARCAADKEAAKTTQVVTALTANVLSFADGWLGVSPSSYYIGGIVEWDTPSGRESRTILRVPNTTDLVLNAAPQGLAIADSVDIFRGCPRTLEGCRDVHNNVINYGGHPWIPTHNPVGKNNHT